MTPPIENDRGPQPQGNIGTTALAGCRLLVIMPSIPLQGMERANIQIMKLLRERGADVLFVTEGNHGQRVSLEVEAVGCRWEAVSVIRSLEERLRLSLDPRVVIRITRSWLRAARQISEIAGRHRPTHLYITSAVYLLYTLPAILRSRVPVLLRVPNPPESSFRGLKKRLNAVFWHRLVPTFCDAVICNSEYTRSRLLAIGLDPSRVRRIYNSPPERAAPSISDAPRLAPDRFRVVYLGRIRPNKGVQQVYEAALQLINERGDIDFHLAGEYHWQNPFAEALIAEVRGRGLESRIHFHGTLEDVYALLRSCQLHVCPSISTGESLPNVLLEAKRCGLPSVVFPTAGIPEAVTHLVDGYVCRECTSDALREGIRYFLEDPAKREAAGREASRSLERFDRERAGDEWCRLLLDLGS